MRNARHNNVQQYNQNIDDPSNTQPINQAGHHTHQTTTWVHIPQTSQPKAAWVRTVSTETPIYRQTPRRTVGGETRLRSTRPRLEIAKRNGAEPCKRATKLSGVQRSPIMNEREKLRVARVERERPRRSRENDLMRWYCWGMIGFDRPRPLERIAARRRGRTMSTITNM